MTDKEIKPEVDSQAQKKKRQAEKYRAREAESERWKQSDRDRETWIAVDKLMTEKEKQGREKEQAERVLPPPPPPSPLKSQHALAGRDLGSCCAALYYVHGETEVQRSQVTCKGTGWRTTASTGTQPCFPPPRPHPPHL